MKLEKNKLEGDIISLEPIGIEHLDELIEAAHDPSIWQWMTFALNVPEVAELFVNNVATMPEKGLGLGFVIRCKKSNAIIGGTGYWHVDHIHQKLEVGGSWVTPNRQRSGANAEAKYLMLMNAFENLGCKRVGFSIDTRNRRSLEAIARVGATQEGVQRSDMTLHDGRDRDSAIFSIISPEWARIKKHLEKLLSKHAN